MKLKKILNAAVVCIGVTAAAYQIELSDHPTLTEQTAKEELAIHLKKMTGKDADGSGPVFRIIGNKKMGEEGWKVTSFRKGVLLEGGLPRGVLYAVYHYLEDICQVRWWTPCEETVPSYTELPVKKIDISGKPAMTLRSMISSYGRDEGRFAARNRINHEWDDLPAFKYGSGRRHGGPYFVHACNYYLPNRKFFPEHPEWYALRNGKRLGGKYKPDMYIQSHQLCLSNREMRKAFIAEVGKAIRKDAEAFAKRGEPAPKNYDVTQADSQEYCECDDCVAERKRCGGHSGQWIDFVNEVAAAYPEKNFIFEAYQFTQNAPTNPMMIPRDNVIVCLADTLSNNVRPARHPANGDFLRKMREWLKFTKNLRLWDYAITFKNAPGLPYASEFCYEDDYRLYAELGIREMVNEIEEPILGDSRDYKFWLLAHFYENPTLSFEKLSKDFANGYYGPAAELFLRYRRILWDSQQFFGTCIQMFPGPGAFTHLDIPTLQKINGIMEEGERLLAGKEPYLRRWHFVRLSVDRAIMARRRTLMLAWMKKYGSLNDYPFDAAAIIHRIEQYSEEVMTWRVATTDIKAKQARAVLAKELASYRKPIPASLLAPPEKFKDIPRERLFDFTPDVVLTSLNTFAMVEDDEAETKWVRRRILKGDPLWLKKFNTPDQVWGIYTEDQQRALRSAGYYKFKATGHYDWYYLGDTRLTGDAYFFFPWDWMMQITVGEAFDPNNEQQLFEVWVNFKFEGPFFKGGKKEDENKIFFQRLVLVQKENQKP